MTLSEELSKLSDLRANGALSEEEFATAKARLLDAQSANSRSGKYEEQAIAGVNAFRRSRTDRLLGGVCGGIARSTGVESWVGRLLFTVLFVFAGMGLLAYVLLWIFVPSD